MKKCFDCGNKLPHFLFDKRPSGTYQRPSDKGLSTTCKRCVFRQTIRQGGIFYKWENKWKKEHPTIPASKLTLILFALLGTRYKVNLVKYLYEKKN